MRTKNSLARKGGAVALGAIALIGASAGTEFGKSLVAFPMELVRDVLKPSAPPVPTLGNEVRVVAPEGLLFTDIHITRPISGRT